MIFHGLSDIAILLPVENNTTSYCMLKLCHDNSRVKNISNKVTKKIEKHMNHLNIRKRIPKKQCASPIVATTAELVKQVAFSNTFLLYLLINNNRQPKKCERA